MAVFLGCTSTGPVGLCFLWFYGQELPKAQPTVVLVLKASQKTRQRLKVSSDLEKPADIIDAFDTTSRYLDGSLNINNI